MIEVSAKTMVSREKWVKFATCAGVAPSGHAVGGGGRDGPAR